MAGMHRADRGTVVHPSIKQKLLTKMNLVDDLQGPSHTASRH